MIFNHRHFHFDIPYKKINDPIIHHAYSNIGALIDDDGYIAPCGSYGTSTNRKIAIKKALSESIERRALMIGGKKNEDHFVETWDLINEKPSVLPYKFTRYNTDLPYFIDTTGTAVHPNGTQAVLNAIYEIIEKNALFLFWYGKMAYKLDYIPDISKPYYDSIIQSGYEPVSFLIDYFRPINVVITLLYNESSQMIQFVGGLGSNLHLKNAYTKSLSEAIQLKEYFERRMLFFNSSSTEYQNYQNDFLLSQKNKQTLEYVKSFKYLPIIKDLGHEIELNNKQQKLKYIINHLPNWLRELHVIQLNSFSLHHLKVIKIFSKDLYNHVPKKKHLNLQLHVNKQTINLSKKCLAKIPDCILV